jgi:type III secretion protein J
MRLALAALGLLTCLAGVGCAREVATGLDEADANRGVVALARAGVDAEKAPDPTSEGHFKITVGRDEATVAISVLASEEIPRAKVLGPAPAGLLPSPEADRAARVLAMAAHVEQSLGSIDGVHDARVHLDVPQTDALAAALVPDGKALHATASVLIRHRGANPPVSVDDVRKLVSGAVAGLPPEAVAVVMVPIPASSLAGDRELAHLGPIAVTRGSLGVLRVIAGGLLSVVALLAVALLALAVRVRRLKDEALESAGASDTTRRAAVR